eukprot:1551483-Amphidinium_carterae.1
MSMGSQERQSWSATPREAISVFNELRVSVCTYSPLHTHNTNTAHQLLLEILSSPLLSQAFLVDMQNKEAVGSFASDLQTINLWHL